jgi:hypothetical protein
MKANTLAFAERAASLICEADKLISGGVAPDLAARMVGVPSSMMRNWRAKARTPAPEANTCRTLGEDHWSEGLRVIKAVVSEVRANTLDVLPPDFNIERAKAI